MQDKLYTFVFLVALAFMLIAIMLEKWDVFGYGLGMLVFGRVMVWVWRGRGDTDVS